MEFTFFIHTLIIDCTGRSQAGLKWLGRLCEMNNTTSMKNDLFANLRLDYNTGQRYRNFKFYVPPEARARLPIPGGYEHGDPWLYTFLPKPGVERR